MNVNIMPRSPGDLQRLQVVLQDEDSFGTTLLVLAADVFHEAFGADTESAWEWASEWHPKTIRAELERLSGVKMPQENFDRLMAAVAVITTDQFFKDVTCFVPLACTLAGSTFEPGAFEKADIIECAWAVTEALLLQPPDNEDPEPFCDDVRAYITQTLLDDGFVTPPDVLRIALDGDFSSQVRYNFSDDPILFEAVMGNQQDKTKEVEEIIRECLEDLFAQLKGLPLKHGNVTELESRVSQMWRSSASEQAA